MNIQFYLDFYIFLFMANGFAEDHTYKSGNQNWKGYVIDKGKNAPLVFLVHDWDGIDEYEKKRSQMIADLGYSVLRWIYLAKEFDRKN